MNTIKIADKHCPECGYRFDAVSLVSGGGRGPATDDYTLCIGCCSVMRFNDDMTIRKASEEDLASLPPHHLKQIQEMIVVLQKVKARMAQ